MFPTRLSAFLFFFFFFNIRCFLFFHAALFPPLAHSLSFSISHFDAGGNNIAFEGDATSYDTSIELNTVRLLFRAGRATYAQPMRLWDSHTGILADFTTRFSFTIDTLGKNQFSDGFAFFMASVGYPIPPNSAGGYLGLFNTTTGDGVLQNQIVLVEFDTWYNEELDDPTTPHVGINNNSIKSLTNATFDFASNKQGHALITYDATSFNLNVCWSFAGSDAFSPNSCLSYQIDLKKCLPEFVVVGFSAATGVYPERHLIQSWDFNSSLNDQSGQVTGNKTRDRRKNEVIIAAILSTTLVLVLAIAVGCFVLMRKKKNVENVGSSTVEFDLDKAAIPRRFYYQELVAATNGFASERRLGQGGSGQVYKGILSDLGRIVAVKRIFVDFENSKRIFINEVKIISRLIHKNLVQFIGWCHEGGEFLLVFEYMPNGSLDTHLFGKKRTLPWSVRYKIALGVVIAIHYLHEEAEQCVLHRDIKSANVLLDTDFGTKLGDFGVEKLVDPRLRTQVTGVVGTYGYLAPEYVKDGRASKESDMYSFGVVALEIACGRRTYQDGEYHIPLWRWVWDLHVEGSILNAADEGLKREFDENEMERLLHVGLWCTYPNDKKRPKAAQVIKVLQGEASMPEFPRDMHDDPYSVPNHGHGHSHWVSSPVTTHFYEPRQRLTSR